MKREGEAARMWPGSPFPLGAHWDGSGTNVSVFSAHAEAVELCLFDDAGVERRVELPERTGPWWHGYLPGLGPGQRYGLRVHGPYRPGDGHRCNPAKLLVDPYARALDGELVWDPAVFGYRPGGQDGEPDGADSAPFVPKAVVVDGSFDWSDDVPPRVPWHETVIYEAHVKGLTARHPEVPPAQRGTFAGLACPPVIDHLRSLGVTAVELLPVHHFVTEHALTRRGLRNYWGYNPLGYFAPHAGYRHAGQPEAAVSECKEMVRALHRAGIEVILDVVYNHSAEGDERGPTLSLRGLDNASYYRLHPDDRRRYVDYTGTGNTLDLRHPAVMQMVMDSLRYWVNDMHVDGFRFDLASALARGLHDVDRLSAFFDVIQQDPVIGRVKLIAEPWDVGDGGYQVGNFPPLWSEWNGRYRDTMRDLWLGRPGRLAEFGYRFCGSSDLYADDGRSPFASVNFVTAHDGFTLRDLVSYDTKHNEANGEGNRDGTDDHRSWNCGVEGDTDDPAVNALRARQQRNLLATLFLSHGVAMLPAGDELGRTQRGNNNAYCQDNELSWVDWVLSADQRDLLVFTRRLAALRRRHPALRRRGWFQGRPICGSEATDIAWFHPAGTVMTADQWEAASSRSIGVFLNGGQLCAPGSCGEPVVDDSLLLLFNADEGDLDFRLPGPPYAERWELALDTANPAAVDGSAHPAGGDLVTVPGRSVVAFRAPAPA